MDFTIYSLGDMASFQGVLNAVAMFFQPPSASNGSGLWVSANPLGLGMGAFVGMLIGLIMLIYQAAVSQKIDARLVFFPVFIYALLTVPKVTVQLEDITTGNVATVANVPVGLAFPAAVMSDVAYYANQVIETVFSTVDGNYQKLGDVGFQTPLKLLNGMRFGQGGLALGMPNLDKSLKELTVDCLNGRPEFNPTTYMGSTKPTDYVLTTAASVSGLTVYYSSTDSIGTPMTCPDAAAKITTDLSDFYNGTNTGGNNPSKASVIKTVNHHMGTSGKGANKDGSYSQTDLETAFQNMLGLPASQARDFAMLTATDPIISGAVYCAAGADSNALAHCLSFGSSNERWKEDEAAAGSQFMRIMASGTNFMIFLSYALFPIVVLVMVMTGPSGPKALASFTLFCLSAQMWLPIASLINFIMQLQISAYVTKIKGGPGGTLIFLDPASYPAVYDQLSQFIALSSSMLASVPLLCLGIFSGSMFALSKVAERWTARDHYDEGNNVPAPIETKPIATSGGIYQTIGAGPTQRFDRQSAPTYGTSDRISSTMSARKSASEAEDSTISNQLGQQLGYSVQDGTTASVLNSFSHSNLSAQTRSNLASLMKDIGANTSTGGTVTQSTGSGQTKTDGVTNTTGDAQGSTNTATKTTGTSLSGQISAGASGGAGGASVSGGVTGGASTAHTIANASATKTEIAKGTKAEDSRRGDQGTTASGQESQGNSTTQGSKYVQDKVANFANSLSKDERKSLAHAAIETNQLSKNKQISDSATRSKGLVESAERAVQSTTSEERGLQINGKDMMNRLRTDEGFRNEVLAAGAGLEQSSEYEKNKTWFQRDSEFGATPIEKGNAADAYVKGLTLFDKDPAKFGKLMDDYALRGKETDYSSPTHLNADSNDGLKDRKLDVPNDEKIPTEAGILAKTSGINSNVNRALAGASAAVANNYTSGVSGVVAQNHANDFQIPKNANDTQKTMASLNSSIQSLNQDPSAQGFSQALQHGTQFMKGFNLADQYAPKLTPEQVAQRVGITNESSKAAREWVHSAPTAEERERRIGVATQSLGNLYGMMSLPKVNDMNPMYQRELESNIVGDKYHKEVAQKAMANITAENKFVETNSMLHPSTPDAKTSLERMKGQK